MKFKLFCCDYWNIISLMIYISTFRKGLFQFLNRFLNPSPSWRSNYDVWMRCQQITSAWRKVCCRYEYWRLIALGYYDTNYWRVVALGYYDANYMMGLFTGLITINFDTINQGVWVFFYEQERWCLHIQSTVLSSLVITSMVSYAVFRTRFLHRIWYCS